MSAKNGLIGKLTLDIKDVEDKVKAINSALGNIGKNVNVKLKIADEVKKQLEKIYQEMEKGAEKVKSAADKVSKSMESFGGSTKNNKDLAQTVALYREYYASLIKVEQAKQQGNKSNQDLFQGHADVTKAKIDAVSESLRKEAEQFKAVEDAQRRLAEAQNKTLFKQENANTKEIEKATQAYIKMLEARSKLRQLEIAGKQDTAEYAKAAKASGEAADAFKLFSKEAKDAAKASSEAKSAMSDLAKVEQAVAQNTGNGEYLTTVKQKYFELTEAIKRYNAEAQIKNDLGMATEQAKIDSIMNEVHVIEQAVQASDMEASAKQNVLNVIQQCVTAETQHTSAIQRSATSYGEMESQITGVMTRMFSLMAVIRAINSLISNTVEYVSEYYDRMNEIQIITQKSSAEVAELGENYRDIAELMNVSSLDIADAAVYFTRQGLAAEEIEQRLINVTRYAKTANVEFKEASEIVTAVVNSMRLAEHEAEDGRNATQRVADVFLKVGDNAATSGQEIGSAMQKAAAAAGAFGMSFEWLAAYIATVSETTRQEARTIGTAFNTIIARLHQIKQNGYNSEDETKINDIQKALAKIDIALMDQNNEWRDMDTIFQEIGEKWGELDGKTKSYIATTMAGVKQQNVFLALMNDLGKGIEGNSRAWELYEKAMNSAGTAEEKYAIWTDSVAASQERLTLSQEKFYSLLDANVIKGYNDALAGMLNMITSGAEAWGNWTVILPAVAGAIVSVTVALNAMNAAAAGTKTMLTRHPIIAGIAAGAAALAVLITTINAFGSAIETQAERIERANKLLTESRENINSINALSIKTNDMFAALASDTDDASGSLDEYNSLLSELANLSPEAKAVVDALKDGMIGQTEAMEKLNSELEKRLALEQKLALSALRDKYINSSTSDDRREIYQKAEELWSPEVLKSSENLASFLQTIYSHTRFNPDYYLGKDAKKFIKEQLEDLNGMVDNELKWQTIGQRFWEKFFGSGEVQSVGDMMRADVDAMIEDLYNTASMSLDSVDSGILRQRMINTIIGSDGQVSYDEWKDAGNKIGQMAIDMIANGFEATNTERLSYIVTSLFGNAFSTDELGSFAASHPEIVNMIHDAYMELINAGFENEDIASVIFGPNDGDFHLDQLTGMVQQMRESIKNALNEVYSDEQGNSILEVLFGDKWENIDFQTLSLLNDLAQLEVSIEDIQKAAEGTESVDEFIANLNKLRDGGTEGLAESEEEVENYVTKLKTLTAEIDKLNKMIETMRNGKAVDFEDLLNLSDAHPEIMSMINDTESLLEALQKLKEMDMANAVRTMRSNIMNSQDFAAQQGVFAVGKGQTLQQYKDELSAEGFSTWVDQYVDQIIITFLASSEKLGNVGKDILGNWMTSLFSESNVDLMNRKIVEIGEDWATLLTETMTASQDGTEGIKWNEDIVMNLTPITSDGEVLDETTFNKYVEDLLAKSQEIKDIFENDKIENGGKGLLISVDQVTDEGFESAIQNAGNLAETLHLLQEAYYGVQEAEKTWLELQIEEQELNEANEWAKSNGYIDQLNSLKEALSDGGIEAAMDIWNQYDQKMQKSILETYPALGKAMLDVQKTLSSTSKTEDDAAKSADRLGKSLDKAQKHANAKYFKDTYAAMQKLEKGTTSAADAYAVFDKEVDGVRKAMEDITDVTQKMAESTDVEVNDVKNLASALGISADQILNDWPKALELFDEMKTAGEETYDALNREAFFRVTGTSESDFSDLESGLISVENLAQSAIDTLTALGDWTTEEIDLPQKAAVWHPGKYGGGYWTVETMSAGAKVLKPAGKNPFKGGGGGGSGGGKSTKKGGSGGGGGKKNQSGMTEVEKSLDMMDQMNSIQEYQQGFYQSQQNFYANNGQLQGVIAYMQKERTVLEEQNNTLEKNLKIIEDYLAAKRAELATLNETDDSYAEVADDVDKLQKAHQNYTKQLVDNKTAIDGLNKSIDEQRNKIRDMEIDLRNTIYKAIEDREKKIEDMLNSEIEMEDKILEIITRRYEDERDQIIETTQLKIQALEDEKDLLNEQLQIRKKQAAQEDKIKRLAELEAQYQRILADPTRAKEAKSIYQDILDLRDELAWEAAENEIEAQQKSIDQQIDSLDGYIEYINSYYEEMFRNPKKLIAEMKSIMQMTDDEIIQWLKDNDEEYAKATETRQTQLEKSWKTTLDSMKGRIKTYWDEVEDIISKGDDYIIQFLKDNSEEYAKAGKLQAEKYVDEWKKKLTELENAYKNVATVAASTYDTIAKGDNTSDGGGGGGVGGGGSGGSGVPNPGAAIGVIAGGTTVTDHGYSFTWITPSGKKSTRSDRGFASKEAAHARAVKEIEDNMKNEVSKIPEKPGTSVYEYKYNQILERHKEMKKSIKAYADGGIFDFTGPIWVDGSKDRPERILNPRQNELFEAMVKSLESISKISVPNMPDLGNLDFNSNGGVSVGDIIVNVENLDSDEDYEEMARKVGEILMERIGRLTPVGGIRINQ